MWFAAALLAGAALAPAPASSRITAVTVYPDRAEITREAPLTTTRGTQHVVLGPLPLSMDDNSLRLSALGPSSGVSLGDIEVRVLNAVMDRTPELTAAEETLARLMEDSTALDDRQARIEKMKTLLASLQSASASQFAKEMASTDLKPQTWQGAYEFLMKNLDGLAAEERATRREKAALSQRIAVAQAEVARLQAQRSLAHKEVSVMLEAEDPSRVSLSLSYAQPGARWAPSYEAVMDPDTGEVTLAMFGWVKQFTGETWEDVRVTLATGAPSLGIDLPQIAALTLAPFAASARQFNADEIASLPIIGHNYQDLLVVSPGVTDAGGGRGDAKEIGGIAGNKVNVVQRLAAYAQADTVVTFQVPGTLSLAHDGQPRRVGIARATLKGHREHLLIPSVRPAAFLLARVTAPSDRPILAGSVSHYVGTTLVGSSSLPAVAPGEEFVLSFGVDDRVKVDRPSLPDTTEEKGSDRILTHASRVTVTNRTGRAIDLKVKDRVPIATDDDIRVSVASSTTPGYTQDRSEPGIYTWSFTMPPDQKKEVSLSWSVRHPAVMQISALR